MSQHIELGCAIETIRLNVNHTLTYSFILCNVTHMPIFKVTLRNVNYVLTFGIILRKMQQYVNK